MKTKNYLLKRSDGLYVIQKIDSLLGFTNKANATHFISKIEMKKASNKLRRRGYSIRSIDLNKKN